jgi:uncharacterized protein YbgA (DUF1722 family)/uncharacterized protein YbbK (DUF523 family)
MSEYPRPTVVVSRCLGFDACRYDGQIIHEDFVSRMREHVEFITVCPEVEAGLGIPRDPIRLVQGENGVQVVQPSTGNDFTQALRSVSTRFLEKLAEVDGFLLKNRSPSCGLTDAKVYPKVERSAALRSGPGVFAEEAQERFPHVIFQDEGRLTNAGLRHHFLTAIFTRARFREVRKKSAMGALVDFHSRNKYLLMTAHQAEMRKMGKAVANHERRPAAEVIQTYGDHLSKALARPPRYTANVNSLQHALGYVTDHITARERKYFLDLVDRYRDGQLPLSAVLTVIWGWIVRFEVEYLSDQTYFAPYPQDLIRPRDSAKRDQLRDMR